MKSPIRGAHRWVVVVGMALISCPGCAKPEPTTLETARVELRRVLDIWKNGKFYVAGEAGKGAKSAEGHDIDRFFPGMNMWHYRLVTYEILDGREDKPGEFQFKVSQTVRGQALPILTPSGKKTATTVYHVYRSKAGRWLVVDSRLEAAARRLGFRRDSNQ